ncbi:MAG: sigma-70 family RNA polymerase sigma factor [Bacteroidaceae bacterium]|nr:sigma-70 family RNA polymerase sigma factor [Bacteroidaceae bacterium]
MINRKGHEEQFRKLYPHEQQLSLNPVHKLERWERIQDFMENDMPKETYEIIRLCFLEELSYKQAAEQKHMSVGYINKQIVYGLRLLRDKFNAQKKK